MIEVAGGEVGWAMYCQKAERVDHISGIVFVDCKQSVGYKNGVAMWSRCWAHVQLKCLYWLRQCGGAVHLKCRCTFIRSCSWRAACKKVYVSWPQHQ